MSDARIAVFAEFAARDAGAVAAGAREAKGAASRVCGAYRGDAGIAFGIEAGAGFALIVGAVAARWIEAIMIELTIKSFDARLLKALVDQARRIIIEIALLPIEYAAVGLGRYTAVGIFIEDLAARVAGIVDAFLRKDVVLRLEIVFGIFAGQRGFLAGRGGAVGRFAIGAGAPLAIFTGLDAIITGKDAVIGVEGDMAALGRAVFAGNGDAGDLSGRRADAVVIASARGGRDGCGGDEQAQSKGGKEAVSVQEE